MTAHTLRLKWPLLLMALFCLARLQGQNAYQNDISFSHLGIEHGLSQSTVMHIHQDHKGFVWICTQDGLNRYDGVDFIHFKRDVFSPNTLSGSELRWIIQDHAGYLWIATRGAGLNRYDPQREVFTQYHHDHRSDRGLSHNDITCIFESNDSTLWVGTNGGGLNRYNRNADTFAPYSPLCQQIEGSTECHIVNMIQSEDGGLWVATDGIGLIYHHPQTNKTVQYLHDPERANSLASDHVSALMQDHQGRIWIGTDGSGLQRLLPKTGEFTAFTHQPGNPHSLSDDRITTIFQDSQNQIWIGTMDGLNLMRQNGRQFNRMTNVLYNPKSLVHNRINCITEDASGLIWFGTWSGISLYNPHKKRFRSYQYESGDPHTLKHNVIFSMCQDHRNDFWIATFGGGLNRLSRKTGRVDHVRHNPSRSNSISSDNLFYVYEDRAGELWVGTEGHGLNRWNRDRTRWTRYRHDENDPNSLADDDVMCIIEDHWGGLWLGTRGGGLNRFDRQTGHFTRYLYDVDDPHSISHNDVFSFFEDETHTLWIGTWGGGLNRYDRTHDRFIRYKTNPQDSLSLSDNLVCSMHVDQAGVFWVGTGNGLNIMNRETGTFTHLTENNGLPNSTIYGILEEKKRPVSLWLSTNFGLSRFTPSTGTFKNYDKHDGLVSNEFNSWAYYQCDDGEMFFGSINGLNAFYPEEMTDEAYVPPVVFTDVKIFNQSIPVGPGRDNSPYLEKSITYTDQLVLKYKRNMLTIEYAALHFGAPFAQQYAYKLEGLESEWHDAGNRRFATYANLPPGKFIFRVKTSNMDGVWNEEGSRLSITIIPPFWKTPVFYILSLLLIIFTIFTLIHLRLRAILNKKEELEQVVALRTGELREANATKDKFFSIVAHDLKNALSVQLSGSRLLSSHIEDFDQDRIFHVASEMKRNTQNLFSLLENLLMWSRMQMNRMDYSPRPVSVKRITEICVAQLQAQADKKELILINEIPDEIVVTADSDMLEFILRNLIGNAIKFSNPKGRIDITAIINETTLHIEVKDEGVGMSAKTLEKLFHIDQKVTTEGTNKERGTGLGLILCHEFVQKHNGRISVSSVKGEGTVVTVFLPAQS